MGHILNKPWRRLMDKCWMTVGLWILFIANMVVYWWYRVFLWQYLLAGVVMLFGAIHWASSGKEYECHDDREVRRQEGRLIMLLGNILCMVMFLGTTPSPGLDLYVVTSDGQIVDGVSFTLPWDEVSSYKEKGSFHYSCTAKTHGVNLEAAVEGYVAFKPEGIKVLHTYSRDRDAWKQMRQEIKREVCEATWTRFPDDVLLASKLDSVRKEVPVQVASRFGNGAEVRFSE